MRKLLALCLMVILAVPALAQTPGTAYLEPNTGVAFPARLGPMQYGGMMDYARHNRPDLGVSLRYGLPGTPVKADIFLYHLGKQGLGTGLDSPQVPAHFQETVQEVFQMEKLGRYQGVKKISQGQAALQTPGGALPFMHVRLAYTPLPGPQVSYTGPLQSELYLTAYKGQFLKIRFSYPDDAQKGRYEQARDQFRADLGKILK